MKNLGFIRSPSDTRDYTLQTLGIPLKQTVERPNWKKHVRIRTQIANDCGSHAVNGLRECMEAEQMGYYTRFGRGYTYGIKQANPGEEGMAGREACSIMVKYGACEYDKFPFEGEQNELLSKITPIRAQLDANAALRKASAFVRLTSRAEIEAALQFSPVFIGTELYSSFYKLNKYNNIASMTGDLTEGHGMYIVDSLSDYGYDTANSWGEDWGKDGFGILPFDYPIFEAWGFLDKLYLDKYIKPADFRIADDQPLFYNRYYEKRRKTSGIIVQSSEHLGGSAQEEYIYLNSQFRNLSRHIHIDSQQIIKTVPELEMCMADSGTIADEYIVIWVGENDVKAADAQMKFAETWKRLIWTCADLCVRLQLAPDQVLASATAKARFGDGFADNPINYFYRFGKTWSKFQTELKAEIERQKNGGDSKVDYGVLIFYTCDEIEAVRRFVPKLDYCPIFLRDAENKSMPKCALAVKKLYVIGGDGTPVGHPNEEHIKGIDYWETLANVGIKTKSL